MGQVLAAEYEVFYAGDGVEALEIAREHKDELALILLDLIMPRMDGKEFLKITRDDPELKQVPKIVITSDQQSEVECLKLGAMDFIPKPYPAPEIVQARVQKCIELSEDRDTIRSTERDPLTRLFRPEHFNRYVGLFDQHYPFESMDAIVVDINHFHMINERHGRQAGDQILRSIGERIRQIARRIGGVGCRKGADTFLIYGPHTEDYEAFLGKIHEALDPEDEVAGKVRLRMGVYSDVDKTLEVDRRFDRAKLASDSVRGNYTAVVGIYNDKMREEELYHERLLEDFLPAIEKEQFRVFFQPKFDIRSEKPVLSGAEALVRWEHPEFGLISPGDFIPLLEENGLILELDRFVWSRTAARIRQWKDTLGYAVPVSVNVSRIDVLMPNLKEIFLEILKEYGLTTRDIILEITESAYSDDSEQMITAVRELRSEEQGFKIEMDDFGTGYSALGILTKMPIDALKLDISFIRNAFGEKRDLRLIRLIIDISNALHVPVIAEGVETEEQYLTLKELGCDYVQGFYFSEPVPHDGFEKILVKEKDQT